MLEGFRILGEIENTEIIEVGRQSEFCRFLTSNNETQDKTLALLSYEYKICCVYK